jgi:hypothetical protein
MRLPKLALCKAATDHAVISALFFVFRECGLFLRKTDVDPAVLKLGFAIDFFFIRINFFQTFITFVISILLPEIF